MEDIMNKETPESFDIVSIQFSVHYAFETEEKARTLLKCVSGALKPGGAFVGTVPNAYWVV
jgi:mRNA (guanine-N7-)-methyltransferase